MIWVRSQNKEVLVEVENLAIFSKEGSYEIHSYTECLGKYSTKEKALKVLDKIQRAIISQLCDINRIVFQMPQDDEVEE